MWHTARSSTKLSSCRFSFSFALRVTKLLKTSLDSSTTFSNSQKLWTNCRQKFWLFSGWWPNLIQCKDTGSVSGSGRSPGRGHGNPLQYSCLENPMNRGSWWGTVHRVTSHQTLLKWLSRAQYRCYSPSKILTRLFLIRHSSLLAWQKVWCK